MPTGYTAAVENGQMTELRDFILTCARGMGACIMQRDDPIADPPKHRQPSGHYVECLATAQADERRLSVMSLTQADVEAETEYVAAVKSYDESTARQVAENARYEAMIDKVVRWVPPTSEHEGLKTFMLDQLRTSKYDYWPKRPVRMDATMWLATARERAAGRVEYYTREYAEDAERCASQNAWIDALYASLPEVVVKA